jgi:hypothetical protein
MTCSVLLAIPAIALADDISNNLDASVDAAAETMPLTLGGDNGTTDLYIVERNGDGKNGCNLTGSTTASFSVSSSNTAVATVSPSSVTFGACGETKTLTVTPVGEGTATISLAQTANTTAGTFNLAPATFTVNVTPPPNTAPTVTVGGVTGGASYNKGSVPAATCNVVDAEDGNSSFPATLSAITGPYASDGIGSQTASCEYTDGGGLQASASETYGIVDPSAPVITKVVTPASPDGSNGWYTSDVTVEWTVSEPESPNSLVKTGCEDQNITSDQAETTYSCSATSAGGSADEQSVTIKRDATDPTVALDGGPSNGESYNFGSVPSAPTCDASDATSGLASCLVTGYSSAVGTHTVTATATDNAGNENTASSTYTVKPYTVYGFYQPVDMGMKGNTDLGTAVGTATPNAGKAGQTIPLKFEIFNGTTELTDTSQVKTLVQQVGCTSLSGPEDLIENYATGGTSLRYDTTGGQFIFNWQTPKGAGGCYKVTMTAQDNSFITAYFTLRK